MIGDALGMVAGRHRDHPGAAFVLAEALQFVQRAALLERAGRLQRLELQEDFAAGHLAQSCGPHRRGAHHRAGDRPFGAADIGDRHRQIGHGEGSRVSVAPGSA